MLNTIKKTVCASVLAAALCGAASPAQARIGVVVDAGGAFSLGTYLQTKGTEYQNGNGFNGRVALVLGNWFLGYDYTQLSNAQVCNSTECFKADQGSTKFHAFTATYNIYFASGAFRPFLALGFGAVFGTLGSWQSSAAQNNVFGGDFRASFGFEIPMGSKFFLRVEGRYRYLLTNNPVQNLQQDLALGVLLGDPASTVRETIQDAHIVQAVLGIGAHF